MGRGQSLRPSIEGFLVGGLLVIHSTAAQAQALSAENIPPQVEISEIAVGLSMKQGGGGCYIRCRAYSIRVQGPGIVEYTDSGGEPRDPPQQRTITREEFLSVLNRFLAARFLEAPAEYSITGRAAITGDAVQFLGRVGGTDAPTWYLALRIGTLVRTVQLESDYPPEMEQLRMLLDGIGGPTAWQKQ